MTPTRTLLVLLALGAPALAQDDAPAPDPTSALLEGLTDYDADLAGDHHYGIYLSGTKSIGVMHLEVGKAPAEEAGVYRAEMKINLAFGPSKLSEHEVAILRADLGLVSRTSEEIDEGPEERKVETGKVALEDGEFVCTKSIDEREGTFRQTVEGPNHESFVSALLLVRKVDLTQKGPYVFREAVWPGLAAGDEKQKEAKTREIRLSIEAAADYEHRGETLKAHKLVAKREGEPDTVFMVTPDRRLLAFWPVNAPIRMILAADAAEAKKDIKGGAAVDASKKTPEGACAVYILVLAKAMPTSSLDSVMDWGAIHSWLAGVNPGRFKDLDASGTAAMLKAEFDAMPAQLTEDVADQFIGMLTVQKTGEGRADVNGPGLPNPFKVEKQADGSWKITRFPAG